MWIAAAILIGTLYAAGEGKLTAVLERTEYFGAATAGVRIEIANNGDTDWTELTLKLGDETVLALPETLNAGQTRTLDTRFELSKAELKRGYVTFTLTYHEGGVENLLQTLCNVTRLSTAARAEVYVVLPDYPVMEGETVIAAVNVFNTGNVDILNTCVTLNGETAAAGLTVPKGECLRAEALVTVQSGMTLTAAVTGESGYSGEQMSVTAVSGEFAFFTGDVRLYAVPDRKVKRSESAKVTVNIENATNAGLNIVSLTRDGAAVTGAPARVEPGSFLSLTDTTGQLREDTVITYTLRGILDGGREITITSSPASIETEEVPAENETPLFTAEPDDSGVRLCFTAGSRDVTNALVTRSDGKILRTLSVVRAGKQVEWTDEGAFDGDFHYEIRFAGTDGEICCRTESLKSLERPEEDETDKAQRWMLGLIRMDKLTSVILYVCAAGCLIMLIVMTAGGFKKHGKRRGEQ